MQTYARVQDGVVAELLSTGASPDTLFHPALRWVAVGAPDTPPGLAAGWRETPDGFAPPPPEAAPAPPSLAELHARIAELAAQLAALAA